MLVPGRRVRRSDAFGKLMESPPSRSALGEIHSRTSLQGSVRAKRKEDMISITSGGCLLQKEKRL